MKIVKSLLLASSLTLFSVGAGHADQLEKTGGKLYRHLFAVNLVETKILSHGIILPGQSQSLFWRFDYGVIPLVTILGHTGSTTMLYAVESVTPSMIGVRAYNLGLSIQSGTVKIGVWE